MPHRQDQPDIPAPAAVFAHSLKDQPREKWEPLEQHLELVADMCSRFAGSLGTGDWGRLLGLWHDIGKYSPAFQAYLMKANGFEAHIEQQAGRVDHSTAGAQHADKVCKPWGRLLAYILAGHHAGLADASGTQSSLNQRLEKAIEPFDAAPEEILSASPQLCNPPLQIDPSDEKRAAFQVALFTRMLFSCLVDADFLATEQFMNPTKASTRPLPGDQLGAMQDCLNKELAELAAKGSGNEVDRCRQQVLAACRKAAELEPGLFTLTVPTGGGKTLASLAFAIKHAIKHKCPRIIYAIPFTSIIEQTANKFREVFAEMEGTIVLEHHSNVDPDAEHETPQSRLAAENWDAPLVVTTNVQFFESLFAATTSRCRKLHNLIGSVIVLDEAQTIPVEMLRPCMAVLRELAADYHCSIVLCTATQPALYHRDTFPIGLKNLREIIPEPETLYQKMKRVEAKKLGKVTDAELVEKLADESSFLAIVNTRSHAARLFHLLKVDNPDKVGLFHLSTNMCGKHRAEHIQQIRDRLTRNEPCCVISTQLIEAGVDIDFPVVYRAVTGLDSVAQAAGRCNREGRRGISPLWLFEPQDIKLMGYLASVASTAGEVIPDFDDLLDPAAVHRYFELHYDKEKGDARWDKKDVMRCFPTPLSRFAFDFRTAAERFRMIEDTGKPVFVPYGESPDLIDKLRAVGPSRDLLRKLQRYTVSVYERAYNAMVGTDIELLPDGYAILINKSLYDPELGLRIDRLGYHDPDSLIL